MTSIQPVAYTVFFFAMLLVSPAMAQDGVDSPKAAPRPRHVFTNDDIAGSASADGLPQIPGLIRCGRDLRCFLQALDAATPAALTRSEAVQAGTALVTSESIWWTTQFSGTQVTVSLRVDALDGKLNEKAFPPDSKDARDAAAQKIAQMLHDFQSIRGKTGSCTMSVKDLKAVMDSASWSIMALGPATNSGKTCSGPAFETPTAVPGEKK